MLGLSHAVGKLRFVISGISCSRTMACLKENGFAPVENKSVQRLISGNGVGTFICWRACGVQCICAPHVLCVLPCGLREGGMSFFNESLYDFGMLDASEFSEISIWLFFWGLHKNCLVLAYSRG